MDVGRADAVDGQRSAAESANQPHRHACGMDVGREDAVDGQQLNQPRRHVCSKDVGCRGEQKLEAASATACRSS